MSELLLADRIALVTGASRGLGRAIAKAYAAQGAHVIALARTKGALEELDDEIQAEGHPPLTLIPEDLTKYEALDQIGAALYERFGRLDILVANAGILGTLTPMGHIKPKEWDRVLAVNLTANWRLLRSMEPLLRASPAGRAIFVTSGAAVGARPYWGTYAVSKAALEAMVRAWAAELNKTNVKANLVNPGRTRTKMRAKAYPGENPETVPTPEERVGVFLDLARA
ncbi:MAG: SDR family NAD(P)-dependent oxidoreductase, partial [Rhodospirillaceae bacterium]